jgi:hypothetical protein
MKLRSRLLLAVFILAISPILATANSVTFTLPGGSTDNSAEGLLASATVTTNSNATDNVIVVLNNLLTAAQIKSAGQLLSDFTFTLSGNFASNIVTTTANEDTPTGTLINVGAGGVVTSQSGSPVKWGFTNTTNSFTLDDLNGGGSPAYTIIGGTAGSFTAYSGAVSSITNGTHSPFVQGTETFNLTVSGVTSSTNILGSVFSFGTAACGTGSDAGTCVTGVPSTVPEPRSTAILLIGGILMAFAFRRKKLQA